MTNPDQKPEIVRLCPIGATIAESTLTLLRAYDPIPRSQMPGNPDAVFLLHSLGDAFSAINLCRQNGCGMGPGPDEGFDFNLTALKEQMTRVFPNDPSSVNKR